MAQWDVFARGASLEFDTQNGWHNSCYQIDSNHFINFWSGSGNDGYAQVFTVNTSTWAVTTAAASLEFDTVNDSENSCYQIDSNHFINFWSGNANDGYVQVFTVDTTTWAVTTAAASLEFDTQNLTQGACYQIDSNHFINFWSGLNLDGYVQVFTVDTTTWEVTTAGASLEFDTTLGYYNSCYQIDSNHFINFWNGGAASHGFVQTFTVNTSTWAVTTAATRLEFDTVLGIHNTCYQIDSNHFINFWSGSGSDGYTQVFTVNTSTWAVTTAAASLEFDTVINFHNTCYQIDSNHFINFWSGPDTDAGSTYDGFAQVFTVNTSTWEVTTAGSALEFDTTKGDHNSCYQIDSNHFINFWSGSGDDGFVQVFETNLIMENLKDNFDDNAINAYIWNDDNASETGGQMVVTVNNASGTYNGISSDNQWNLTSSYALIELVSAGDTSLSFTTYIVELYNATVDIYWAIEYGATDEIVAYKSPDSVNYTEKYRATYNSTDHKWFRIREDAGTVYWDTSTDGTNWTNRASDATGYDLTSLNVFFGVENPASGSTSVVFDNFNVPPVGGGGGTSVQDLIAPGIIPFAR